MATAPPTDDSAGPKSWQPPAATAERSKLWFDETVVVPDAFRDLLVKYSGVPTADVDEHVIQIVSSAALAIQMLMTDDRHRKYSATRPGKSTITRAWASSASWN